MFRGGRNPAPPNDLRPPKCGTAAALVDRRPSYSEPGSFPFLAHC
jgi:hypothetical protein